ncbi:sulfotransferase domain-containing protein [Motiliproteus sp. SC1-56]|uniref:sulfotransferase domain-containing protein n=1 Tax=Motiliproteus sp. SC1-56 TaxID=2799565 RepID=UPI001A8EF85A|nr:sulfotransferase domain-containing protein [Motiliproteus sp. SC1-56]
MGVVQANFVKLTDVVKNATIKPILRKNRVLFTPEVSHRLVVHCGHHKVGTYWFARILNGIAEHYGLDFQNCEQYYLKSETSFFMEQHSYIDKDLLPSHRGSHLIRDPRDMIVSGYYFHLWTKEDWAHLPVPELGFISYQKYLNSLPKEEGIAAEIRRTAKNIKDMARWNYQDPNFYEIKYEELINDEQTIFEKLFRHYGFTDEAVEVGLEQARKFSFKNVAKREIGSNDSKSHLRSGKPGQWRDEFSGDHIRLFEELTGDALKVMGYQND